MSKTEVLYPIFSALNEALKYLNGKEWKTTNIKQKELMKLFTIIKNNDKISLEEISIIENKISKIYTELNDFLKEKGFSIQLEPFDKKESFGVVSILDLFTSWEKGAKKDIIFKKDNNIIKSYPAIKQKNKYFRTYIIPNYSNPIVHLCTSLDDKYDVFITIPDKKDKFKNNTFSLIDECQNLNKKIETCRCFCLGECNCGGGKQYGIKHKYSNVIFPMVDLDIEEDIKWLLGLHTIDFNGVDNYIAQALQQTKIKMNENGLKAKSAVTIEMRCRGGVTKKTNKDLIIDKPFLFWINQTYGLSLPLVAAYITEDDWKKPKDLN